MTNENLGPAERIINTLLNYTDHMIHNRPGAVVSDARANVGVRWFPVTHKNEAGEDVVYRLERVGNKDRKVRMGVLRTDRSIVEGRTIVGEYRAAGLFPEVALWMYQRVAEVWKLDNEFSARWASHAFTQEHRDLKVVLAAFMLVQSRKGDPVVVDDKVAFYDEDYRDIGEAMMLLTRSDGRDFNPKLLLRVREVIKMPAVTALNHQLGFSKSDREPQLRRWTKAVDKWLRYREHNPRMLEGLVKAGFRQTVMDLASMAGYKPDTQNFYEVLRWKQKQADDGRRTMALDMKLNKVESWEGLSEREVCARIITEKPGYKRLSSLVPRSMGITRAIMAAAIEAGSLSDSDLRILSPTLEELGLLQVPDVKARWEKAVKSADDMRTANIAKRMKTQAAKEKLEEGADDAAKKALAEVSRNMRIYVIVDKSASQNVALDEAKDLLSKFVQGFPLDRLHVAVFDQVGRVVEIKHASSAGVTNAFRGTTAGGGTAYGSGVRALQRFQPQPDEDTIFLFTGDEEQNTTFDGVVNESGLRPMAFGLIRVLGPMSNGNGAAVRATATRLGIPCFMIEKQTFTDPYAITRTIRALIASTPVGDRLVQQPERRRQSIVDVILKTELLQKPAWAA